MQAIARDHHFHQRGQCSERILSTAANRWANPIHLFSDSFDFPDSKSPVSFTPGNQEPHPKKSVCSSTGLTTLILRSSSLAHWRFTGSDNRPSPGKSHSMAGLASHPFSLRAVALGIYWESTCSVMHHSKGSLRSHQQWSQPTARLSTSAAS